MQLHNKTTLFYNKILETSEKTSLPTYYIEKDYYICLLLSVLNSKIDGLVFKGGTALSKCFNVIDRFSEDIDLTLDIDHFTKSNKINANHIIKDTCEELNFTIRNTNYVENHMHNKYVCFYIEYPTVLQNILNQIKLEMTYINKTFPYELREVKSYIFDNNMMLEKEFNSPKTFIQVQKLERTLIDKTFALCDYYLDNKLDRQSRHIYDIAHILPKVDLDDPSFKNLITETRELRKNTKFGFSARDDVNINNVLSEIIVKEVYKEDYIKKTIPLLNKPYDYNNAVNALKEIISKKIF